MQLLEPVSKDDDSERLSEAARDLLKLRDHGELEYAGATAYIFWMVWEKLSELQKKDFCKDETIAGASDLLDYDKLIASSEECMFRMRDRRKRLEKSLPREVRYSHEWVEMAVASEKLINSANFLTMLHLVRTHLSTQD